MHVPKVSVVCAIYNRADYIRDTVDSLLSQNYLNYEIVIVNDGSTDPRVREILDSYKESNYRVIHQANTGFTRAIRRAIDESNGDFVALQGAGDVSLPGRLTAQVAYLEAHEDYAVVGCRYVNHVKDINGNRGSKLSRIRSLNPTAVDLLHGNPFGHGEVLMRRSVYEEIGGYREFFDNSQDKDLWLRISMYYKLGIIDACYYERNIFSDGIASNFGKTLKQIAYSRVADVCYRERCQGKLDSVDQFGQLALMSVPRDWSTTWRIIKAVKQMTDYSSLKASELYLVGKLFGFYNMFASFFAMHLFSIFRRSGIYLNLILR